MQLGQIAPSAIVRAMEKRKAPPTGRFGVYLDSDEVSWLRQTRGLFLLKTGQELSTTAIVRAGIEQLKAMDEAKLLRVLERHTGRRRIDR